MAGGVVGLVVGWVEGGFHERVAHGGQLSSLAASWYGRGKQAVRAWCAVGALEVSVFFWIQCLMIPYDYVDMISMKVSVCEMR